MYINVVIFKSKSRRSIPVKIGQKIHYRKVDGQFHTISTVALKMHLQTRNTPEIRSRSVQS